MMESWTECFSKCFILPCATLTRTRNHRVSPENISNLGGGGGRSKSILDNTNNSQQQHGGGGTTRRLNDELNGEINLHYVSDGADDDDSHVVIECPTIFEYPSSPHNVSSSSSPGGGGNEEFEAQRKRANSVSIVDQKASYGNHNNSYLTTVFIETAKRKQLRVVHLRAQEENEIDGMTTIPYNNDNTNNSLPDDSLQMNSCSGGSSSASGSSDDEDEYWFSKWSQRPRLKKFVDQRKTINNSSSNNNAENNKDPNNPTPVVINMSTDNVPVSTDNEALQGTQQEWNPCLNPNDDDDKDQVDNNIDVSPKKQNVIFSPVANSTTIAESESLDNSFDNGFTNLAFQPDDDDDDSIIETATTVNTSTGIFKMNGPPQEIVQDISQKTQSPQTITKEEEEESSSVINSVQDIVQPEKDDDVDALKPLLFFIHGISGSSETFSSQIDYFHKLGYEIVALDLLGHGLSGTPPQAKLYHFESLVQDVVTVFDHFVVDERQVVIIGHGYGACLATVLTRIRPKNARILISISGGGPTPMVSSYWCQTSWLAFPCDFLPRRKKQGRFDNPDLKHILPYNIHENIIRGQIWLDGDPAFHRRISIPTLLVYGMRDKVVNLVEVCEMERTIPRAFLEIINTAGHMVMWDEPKKLNRMMRKFISSFSESQWS